LLGTFAAGSLDWFLGKSPGDFTVRGLSAEGFFRDVFGAITEPLPGAKFIDGPPDAGGVQHTTPVVAFALIGLALLGVVGWLSARRMRSIDGIQLFVLALLAIGLLLSAGVEQLTLDGDIQRMNTVFKFYLHVWILYAAAAAFAAWYVLDVVRPKVPLRIALPELKLEQLYQPAFALGVGVFLIAALVYPVVATPQRVQDRFGNEGAIQPRTDDGLVYALGATFDDEGGTIQLKDDYAAFQWVRENIEGSPVIIEAVTPTYRWGSRFTINTGLPAVSGWDWHQRQQRVKWALAVTQRQEDVKLFYSTPDPFEAQTLLKKYGVKYVILGAVEKNYFPGPGVENIQEGLGGMLRLVFESGETQIFEVVPQTAFAASQ
jgi:uncharacterized membrane protein